MIGDLHSVALVGTDGTIDWFCCPRFDSPSVFASILDAEEGRLLPDRAGERRAHDQAALLPRHERAHHAVPDPGRRGRGARLHADPPRSQARPQAGAAGGGRARRDASSSSSAGRASTTAASAHELELYDGGAVFSSPDLTMTLATNRPLERSGDDVTCRFTLTHGESATFVLQKTEPGARLRPTSEARVGRLVQPHGPLLARLALALHVPRPLARDGEPVGADAQAAHLPPDRRDRRRRDHEPARARRRRAQLGLPLHVGARRRLLDVRAPAARVHRGGRGVHHVAHRPLRRDRLRRGRPAPDHVRHRRPRRPHRGGARPLRGLCAARLRCGSETAPPPSSSSTSTAS